jgi:hypothetical protein
MKYDLYLGMKTLIASIHYPDEAKGFIGYSIRLADLLHADLVLLYVEEPNPYPMGAAEMSGWVKEEIRKGFEDRAGQAKETLIQLSDEVQNTFGTKVNISCSVETEKEAIVLQRMTASDPVSKMVIVENRDIESFWIKKGKTRSIISNLSCPVWVIPGSSRFIPFQQVVYITDYNQEDIPVLKNLLGLMEACDPQITALHVTSDVDFDEKIRQAGFREMLRSKTSSDKITVESLFENEHDDLATATNQYCSTKGTDLIVVMQEDAGFWEKLFRESSAVKLMKQVELPLFIYNRF